MIDPNGFAEDFFKHLRRQQERHGELEHEKQIALIRTQSHALIWAGPPEQLKETITRWYESGCLVASSLPDALQKAAFHFLAPDGSLVIRTLPVPVPEPVGDMNPRQAFVMPLLEKRGWSILDWANEANVSPATAQDYLANKTRPYPSTRLKMAKALNVSVQELPR